MTPPRRKTPNPQKTGQKPLRKIKENAALFFIGVSLVIGVVVVGAQFVLPSGGTIVQVNVPALSPLAMTGRAAFEENCMACHGANGSGTDQGPPLIHDFYNPGHHDDDAFYRAVQIGTPQHHWKFGDMPEQPQVSRQQVAQIIRYVRELQRANGIVYKPHNM